jgi:hypothetical protein
LKGGDVPLNIVNYIEQANLSLPRLKDWKKLKTETELEKFSETLIIKRGLPQGLS